jgi:hypothetical protein
VHKDFQDRAIWLWEILADVSMASSTPQPELERTTAYQQHYKDNTWVAGFNPLNEPTDEEHVRLIAWYERAEKAIRAIDPNHILFLE